MSNSIINDYKPYISNKRTYLKRKKQLNKEINKFKKNAKLFKGWSRRYCNRQIKLRKDDIDILINLYNYNKSKKY